MIDEKSSCIDQNDRTIRDNGIYICTHIGIVLLIEYTGCVKILFQGVTLWFQIATITNFIPN
jgi:hypothetical protein